MPSPFPGMNPYLERPGMWSDFHESFLVKLRTHLAPQVHPRYFVRIQEHLYFHELPDPVARLRGYADLGVSDDPAPVATAAPPRLAAPTRIELTTPIEEESVSVLEVIDSERERVVTVLELLSRSNKYAGSDREQYLAKRQRLFRAGVNYVEIDLLRGGPRTVPDLPPCDYYVMVVRPLEWPGADIWPFRLADPLPVIPVPLRPGEPEPTLDLKATLDAVYDEAQYEYLAYRRPPEPALTAEHAAWAAGFVPAAHARS